MIARAAETIGRKNAASAKGKERGNAVFAGGGAEAFERKEILSGYIGRVCVWSCRWRGHVFSGTIR